MKGGKRELLVVEDNELNREILEEILMPDYVVLQAENGKEGLELLRQRGTKISLVLLDIQMPVMNGYEFLDAVRQEVRFSNIPIIVMTASGEASEEIRCLESGASDFVSKPYNPEIILRRVESMIRLSEASAMLNKVEYDLLTGVLNKEFFYDHAQRQLDGNPEKAYDVLCTDIEAFKLINDRHGVRSGDELLRYVAQKIQAAMPEGAICGRISGDVFAVFCDHLPLERHIERNERFRASMTDCPINNVVVRTGVYGQVDHSLQVPVMCDNALLAVESIKYHYDQYIAAYNETVRRTRLREQAITDSMSVALEERQLAVYFQPKHDLKKDRVGGAEALVRWIHPELGFLSPAEFIPLFERNGFIRQLDRYVLVETCRMLRGWLDAGKPVVPISVNVSRADFETPGLAERIIAIVDEYQLPRELIHLEVTESAYVDNPARVITVISRLREESFCVELDDFGSGYSALGSLNELILDVLKLDMSLVRGMAQERQRCILNCVMELASVLGMETVAEGVETADQAEELLRMGCDFAQGYYYAKPLPVQEFEAYLLRDQDRKAVKEKQEDVP